MSSIQIFNLRVIETIFLENYNIFGPSIQDKTLYTYLTKKIFIYMYV